MSVDTLTLAQRLRAAELPAEHAEAIAAAIGSAVLEGAATKDDVSAVKVELKAEIAAVKTELKSDIQLATANLETSVERMRNQVIVGLISTQLAFTGVIVAAIKLL